MQVDTTPTDQTPPVGGLNGLHQKIAYAQHTMPPLPRDRHVDVKNREGNVLYGYDYITEDALTTATREHLAGLGVATYPSFGEAREMQPTDAAETVIRVRVRLKLVDSETGQAEVVKGYGYGTDKGDKAMGKAQTSGLRQLLGKLLLQAGGDDGEQSIPAGGRSRSGASTTPSGPARGSWSPSEPQVKRLWALAKKHEAAWGYAAGDVVALVTRIMTRTKESPLGTPHPEEINARDVYNRAAEFLGAIEDSRDVAAPPADKVEAVKKMLQRTMEAAEASATTSELPYDDAPPAQPQEGDPFWPGADSGTGGYE